MRVLIAGCGYVGVALGRRLCSIGHEVHGIRRDPEARRELEEEGIRPIVCDITDAKALQAVPAEFDWAVNVVSSSKGGVEDYRRVYVGGTLNLLTWLKSAPLNKFVYTSSTSVYGQTGTESVDESSPTLPLTETSKILIETEQLLLKAAEQRGFPAVVLRVSGIYGPGRGHLFQQYLRGEARLSENPQRLLNMIHLEDLVSGIIGALDKGERGEIYNLTDDEAVTEEQFFRWLSDELGRPMPPTADASLQQRRKRGLTSKRVLNQKMKERLLNTLKFPTYREGYREQLRRAASSEAATPR
jgi:nucleoside-diphosphate-sugar epimerase